MIGMSERLPFMLLLVMTLVLPACQPSLTPPRSSATPVLVATVTPPKQDTVEMGDEQMDDEQMDNEEMDNEEMDNEQMDNEQMDKQTLNETLIAAAAQGDTSTVLRLLAAGADINSRDAAGRTAVMAATHGNQVETVRVLIAAGADINIQDKRLDNPFLYAGAEGLLEILRLTIAAGADTKLTNRFGGTALIPAAERGPVEVVAELLNHTDVDVDHVNHLGWTALLEAVILGDGGPARTEVVRLLIAAGADVNLADSQGVTPLAHARQRGYGAIIALLEAAGAK